MKLGFALVLVNLAGCWGANQPAAPIANQTRPAAPALREPEVAQFGTFDTLGSLHPSRDVPLVEGAMFGWRIKLPCTRLVRFKETVRLPSAGEWASDPDMTLSTDLRTAVVRTTAACSLDGWIEKIWAVAPNDPPGEWIVRIEIPGFTPQEFRASFATPAPPP